jgi:hypothetical protein
MTCDRRRPLKIQQIITNASVHGTNAISAQSRESLGYGGGRGGGGLGGGIGGGIGGGHGLGWWRLSCLLGGGLLTSSAGGAGLGGGGLGCGGEGGDRAMLICLVS